MPNQSNSAKQRVIRRRKPVLEAMLSFEISENRRVSPEPDVTWRTAIGLDLANRPVLEAELLLWRLARQRAATAQAA